MRRLGFSLAIIAMLVAPSRGWAANACRVGASDANQLIQRILKEDEPAARSKAPLTSGDHNVRVELEAEDRDSSAGTLSLRSNDHSETRMGAITYIKKDNQLDIDIEVAPEYQRRGASRALLSAALEKNPDVTSIKSMLGKDNLAVYEDGLRRGLSPEDAIRQTPAYKIREKLGFTEIDMSQSHFPTTPGQPPVLVMRKAGSAAEHSAEGPAASTEGIFVEEHPSEWRNSVPDPGRLEKAETVLGRPVTEKEWDAIWKAHNIGTGPPYTPAEIAEKARILHDEGGFSTGRPGDIRKLQKSWVTGHMALTRESTSREIVDSLSQGVSEENRYVSIPTPDGQTRQAVRIDNVENYGGQTHVTAEIYDTDTHASLVRELYPQELAGMRVSSTARQGLANTGGATVLDESNRYVSFMLDGDRVAGKVVGIEKSDNGEISYWVQHHSYDAQGRDVLVNNHLTSEQAETLRFSSSARAHFSHQPDAPVPRHIRLFNGQIRPHTDFNGALGVAEYRPQGQFLDFDGTYALPKQGWKIHVSAKPEDAQQIAELVLPELRKMGVVHKVVGTVDEYKAGFVNPVMKFGGPNTQVGKFITIYPKDQQQAAAIAKKIDGILTQNHLSGDSHFLPIPGEGRMGNSGGVFVRYGEFTGDSGFASGLLKTDAHGYVLDRTGKQVVYNGQYLNVNQMDIFTMDSATKERLSQLLESSGSVVPDTRGSYKPEWMPDPFNAHP